MPRTQPHFPNVEKGTSSKIRASLLSDGTLNASFFFGNGLHSVTYLKPIPEKLDRPRDKNREENSGF
jgi:hypothetical protein